MAELLFEFDDAEQLSRALRALSGSAGGAAPRHGHAVLEAYTPYSTEEVREALARGRSPLGYFVFAGGVLGASLAYFLQWYLVAYQYPLDVGGRPPHMPLAFVPITFEMGVLAAAFTAFFGVLAAGRLVAPWHRVFEAEGFESASADKFWLGVDLDAVGQGEERAALRERLEREASSLGARRSVVVPSEGEP